MPISVNSPFADSVALAHCVESSGYLHPDYAASLAEFGQPLELLQSHGWLLKRRIPGTDYYDGMGCYPLFCCQDWKMLNNDLKTLENDLVSASLVTDPLGELGGGELESEF